MPFCAGGPRTQATAQKTATWLPGNADGHRIAQADAAAGLRRDVDVIAARPEELKAQHTGARRGQKRAERRGARYGVVDARKRAPRAKPAGEAFPGEGACASQVALGIDARVGRREVIEAGQHRRHRLTFSVRKSDLFKAEGELSGAMQAPR